MTKNVGSIDRMIRVILGITLIALAATNTVGPWGYIGILPLLTGALSWCPAYSVFGFKTCEANK